MAKRDRERNIQAWFDPEDPFEKSVVLVFDKMQKKGLSPKQVIAKAMLCLAADVGVEPELSPASTLENSVEQLTGMVGRLLGMIENGSFVPTNEAAQQAFSDDAEQFDAISASVGSRYRAISFEDEE